jgi:flagellar biosynthesis/type III secretory pathway chaperone
MNQAKPSAANTEIVRSKSEELQKTLNEILGAHRDLLDIVRTEKSALVAMDAEGTETCLINKEQAIAKLRNLEKKRILICEKLYANLQLPEADHRLSQIAVAIQAVMPERAEKLRSIQNALKILIDRIKSQNTQNMKLVEASLEHLQNMKKNVMGESNPMTRTYNRSKQTQHKGEPRMLSKEV